MDNKEQYDKTIQERQLKMKKALLKILKEIPIIEVAVKRAGVSRDSFYRWKRDDREFFLQSEEAMQQGFEFINDMSESQVLALIKEKKLPAITLWLRHHHPRYGAKIKSQIVTTSLGTLNPSDPHYEQYQAMKEIAKKYEDALREKIISNIHEKQ